MAYGFYSCHGWFFILVTTGLLLAEPKNFYEPYFGITTPNMKGWGTSSALIGCIFGALLCFALSDRFGRKRLLILSGFLFAVAAVGTAMANNFVVYNIYRIVGGFGIGIALNLSPMYISEMSPPSFKREICFGKPAYDNDRDTVCTNRKLEDFPD